MSHAPTTQSGFDVYCANCGDGKDADAVVVFTEDNPVPFCDDCADDAVRSGGREYPLCEFYELVDGEPAKIKKKHTRSVRMFECERSGSSEAWLEATNHNPAFPMFVPLKNNR